MGLFETRRYWLAAWYETSFTGTDLVVPLEKPLRYIEKKKVMRYMSLRRID